jgi:hypothetical protein
VPATTTVGASPTGFVNGGSFFGSPLTNGCVTGVRTKGAWFFALVIASRVLGKKPKPAAVLRRLERTARDLGAPGYDRRYGWGLMNAAYATAPGALDGREHRLRYSPRSIRKRRPWCDDSRPVARHHRGMTTYFDSTGVGPHKSFVVCNVCLRVLRDD